MVCKVMSIIINSRIVIRGIIPRHSCFLSIHPSRIQQSTDLKLKHSGRHMASNEFANSRIWQPAELINGTKQPNTYACMVINRKITVPADLVEVLWQNAAYRCTVDGGTNRWRDFLLLHQKSNKLKLPDFITGDFDSATKDTLEYFNDPSVEVIHTPDQNFTDFTKAIHILEPYLLAKGINDIYVLHDTSGRTDHIMGNIQTLYKTRADINVYLISGTSITWTIRPGTHTIHIPKDLVDHTRWCALLPVGSESIVTTKGLKWDLDKSLLAFEKGIVSTSNSYSSQEVYIKVDATILWSMGVFNFHDD